LLPDEVNALKRIVILVAIAGLYASNSPAGDLFPLTEGVQWTYREIYPTEVDTLSFYFEGTAEVNGLLTHVRRLAHRPWLALGVDYWSRDSEGRVYKHGWQSGSTTSTFDPPVLMIDAPLWVGKKWSINTMTSLFGPASAECEVTAIGSVIVPVGTFVCTTIKWTDTTPSTELEVRRSILYPQVAVPGPSLTDYAEGVGRIREDLGVPGRIDELISYGSRVDVEVTTWSAVRHMYK